jgi:hypothetical protein
MCWLVECHQLLSLGVTSRPFHTSPLGKGLTTENNNDDDSSSKEESGSITAVFIRSVSSFDGDSSPVGLSWT